MMKKRSLFCFFIGLSGMAFGQRNIPDSLALLFQSQLAIFPQEKIYLHTDKPYYISGEKIWFRAHVADAESHEPVSISRYVYIELINPLDSIVTRVKIRHDAGAYHGCLPIPDDVAEGDYTMRAYTTFMRSQDEQYICTKAIRIGDPRAGAIHAEPTFQFESRGRVHVAFRFSHVGSSVPIVPQSVKASVNGRGMMNIHVDDDGAARFNFNLPATSGKRIILFEAATSIASCRQFIRIPAPDDDFDVTFYPEGGSLMHGVLCNLAFKAMKSDGQATHISGIVYDQSGIEIQTIKSDYLGMGNIRIAAEKDKTYYAVCENEKGQSKRFDLPAAVAYGYSLAVTPTKDKIHVSVLKPDLPGLKNTDELYLLAHTRGMVQYIALWDHGTNIRTFQTDQCPSGVMHFILFDADMHPVSERLVFVNNQDQAKVTYQPDKENFESRSLLKNKVALTDGEGSPLEGSFSVAVTSDREVTTDSANNILTQLLLASDLRGHIENPAYYFQNTAASEWALDLLMRTQGWRRYNIAELAQGRFSLPSSPLEIGAEISGTVKSVLLGNPVEGIEVSVASSDGYFDNTVTDRDGRFYFHGSESPDSTLFIVSAIPQRRMTRMDLIIDREMFPEKTLSAAPPAEIDRMQFVKYADKAEQQYASEGGMRIYHLPEVNVSAERKKIINESPYYNADLLSPASIITEEDITKWPADIYSLLRRVPGVYVTPQRGIFIRGLSSSGKVLSPLLVVDDIRIHPEIIDDMLNSINIYDIAQIVVLKGWEAASYGLSGGNGVIYIHTKRGEISNRISPVFHIKTVMPLSYQQPAAFYAPKYDTPEKRNAQAPDLRTTIHWEPAVQTDSLGVASFDFYTADDPVSYTVVIEGLTADGRIIRKEEKLWR